MNYRAPVPDAPLLVVSNHVVALDRGTGKVRWSYELEEEARRFTVHEGRVFVLESTGTLHCLDVATGALLGKVGTHLRGAQNMLVDGDRIYANDGHYVAALDFNGNLLWREPVPHRANASNSLCGLGVPGGELAQPDYADGR